ncbi:hypothetical protein BU15DRAFT_71893 [Melanogaster broomeanus]|nr:hypothetical protein BU15DRAFT_71893 [Melanogaster broomeanus]
MDSNIEPTGRASSDSTLTAYRQVATGNATDQQSPASSSEQPTWTSSSLLDPQSQNNLRQASVALDAAYERITQLRNSINNMLSRMPTDVSGTTTSSLTDTNTTQTHHRSLSSEADLRPAHSAVVLTNGEQVVEQLNLRAQRLRSLVSPSARQRLEEFESSSRNHARREFVWDRVAQDVRARPRPDRSEVQPVPLRPRTPPMPDLVLPRVRPPFLDARAPQRREPWSPNRDDSSTMIGMRVAARMNANAGASDGQHSVGTRPSLSQIEQRVQFQTAQIARELENMTDRLTSQRSRRDNVAPSLSAIQRPPPVWPPPPLSEFSSNPTSTPPPPVGSRPPRLLTRDVILVDNTSHVVLPPPISRTSSDGTPIEGQSVTADVRHSLNTAYRDQVAGLVQESSRDLGTASEVLPTLLNRLRRDRVDQFGSSRQSDSPHPGSEPNGRDSASTRTDSPSQAGPTRRRRGWSELYFSKFCSRFVSDTVPTARLNADGDEIDSGDEQSGHARRLRMRLAYGTPNTEQAATGSNIGAIEDILWRTSGSFGSDSEADALSPEATGNLNAESYLALFPSSPVRTDPRRPNPLPTPVEEMLVYPTRKIPQQPCQVVRVSKYASLAGR